MRVLSFCAAVASVFSAFASVTRQGTVLTAHVESGTETYSDEIGSDITKLVKSGAGTLVLPNANAGFKGDVQIDAGVVSVGAVKAIGSGNTVTISDGAQLLVTFASGGQTSDGFPGTKFVIAGDGPDHKGAIFYKGSTIGDSLVRNLELSAPAAVGGSQRWGVGYGGELNLNGHTLTNKACSSAYMIYGTEFKDGAGHFVSDGGTVTFQDSPSNKSIKFNGSHENTFTSLGATLFFWGWDSASPWTLKAFSKTTLKAHGKGGWDGPIQGDGTTLYLTSDASGTGTASMALDGNVTGIGALSVKSEGVFTATLKGESHDMGSLSVAKGTLRLEGGTGHKISNFGVGKDSAALEFNDAGDVEMAAGTSSLYGLYPSMPPARLKVSGGTVLRTPLQTSGFGTANPEPAYSMMFIGNEITSYTEGTAYSNYWATVTLESGADITNNFHIGTRGLGAVYQRNSSAYLPCCANNDAHVGMGKWSYGYWSLADSTAYLAGYSSVARSAGSTGIIVQRGGTFEQAASRFRISRGGDAIVHVSGGGVMDIGGDGIYIGDTDGDNRGGSAQITVTGEGSRLTGSQIIGQRRAGFQASINVSDGGSLEFDMIKMLSALQEGSTLHVNFDGGVWKFPAKASDYNSYFKDDGAFVLPTRLTVYGKGAVFDVEEGGIVNFTGPIDAPTGKSVIGVGLPKDDEFLSTTHIGALRVSFEEPSGGTGAGATAFVSFDDETGAPDGVIVTSPGFGYSKGTVAYVHAMRGEKKWVCEVTLGAVQCGGIVKRGGGYLILKASGSYTGTTRVEGGELRIMEPGAMPSGYPLEMAGGALDSLGNTIAFSTVSGYGTLKCSLSGGGYSVSAGLRASAEDLAEGRTLAFEDVRPQFAADSTVEISGLADLSTDVRTYEIATSEKGFAQVPVLLNGAGRWRTVLSSDGKTLLLKSIKALRVIVR